MRETDASIEKAIAEIESLPIADLRKLWRRLRRSEPPGSLSPTLMRNALAYQVQAERFGDLSPQTKMKLGRYAKKLKADATADLTKGEAPPIGARLVRDWKGERHQVEIIRGGFVYRGEIYRSLSVIARKITGAHWSGPRFFGLKTRRKEGR